MKLLDVLAGFAFGMAVVLAQPLPVCPWCNRRHDMPWCRRPVNRIAGYFRPSSN